MSQVGSDAAESSAGAPAGMTTDRAMESDCADAVDPAAIISATTTPDRPVMWIQRERMKLPITRLVAFSTDSAAPRTRSPSAR